MNHASINRIPTEDDRTALFRALSAWTGNPGAADDLVQQTMIEAWKSDRQPESPSEWRPWLFGIGRNVMLRWRRDLARDLKRSIVEPHSAAILEAAASDSDIDSELEQQEIIALLHDVLDELPSETRRILMMKYINELPQAEIAGQLGIHEKALEGRLHRGKHKLRTHLLTYKPDTAISLGIVSEPNTWQQSTIWCRICGQHHLLARWSDDGKIVFDCPACENGDRLRVYEGGLFERGTNGIRPTFNRVIDYFQTQSEACVNTGRIQPVACPDHRCSGNVSAREEEVLRAGLSVPAYFVCDTCDAQLSFEDLCDCGIELAAGRGFTKRHSRVIAMPRLLTWRDGRDTIQARWISHDQRAEFVAWHDATTGRLLETYSSDT